MRKSLRATLSSQPRWAPQEISSQELSDNVEIKRPWWHSIKEPGSALQIICAAVTAIAIGLIVSTQVDGKVPDAAIKLTGILGQLWLRALKAVVLPLIASSMILAVQRLQEITNGGKLLARWTVGYYIITTLVSIILSMLMLGLVWSHQFQEVSGDQLNGEDAKKKSEEDSKNVQPVHDVVVATIMSLIPDNVVNALAQNELLAVIISAIIVGYYIDGATSSILKAVKEIDRIITQIITFLIKVAPIGVFFLILPNMMRLDMSEIGLNLGLLIGGVLSTMLIHILVIVPIIFFAFTRMNPYSYWIKIAPAWVTAWGTASSAATLSVTLKVAKDRGIPSTIYKFSCPLGCLINMDGTAIYMPFATVFIAETRGIKLTIVQYVIVALLSTLASIGVSPIPSASLVLTLMICESIGVEVTGMYAVIVAIDWFLDRFRTAVNVSGDLFASMIIYKQTGLEDDPEQERLDAEEEERLRAQSNDIGSKV